MNPYSILNIPRDADPAVIKQAYRKLAKQYHPDVNPGDSKAEGKFKDITMAYEMLTKQSAHSIFDTMDFEDLFGFTNQKPRDIRRRGGDYKYSHFLRFFDFIEGTSIELHEKRKNLCASCLSTGYIFSSDTCPTCKGKGQVHIRPPSNASMNMLFYQSCPDCRGTGFHTQGTCTDCKGSGIIETIERNTYSIPARTLPGTIIKYPGKGGAGVGQAPRGDVYVKFDLTLPKFEGLSEVQLEVLRSI
jgi:molecular chaperone DnaJ